MHRDGFQQKYSILRQQAEDKLAEAEQAQPEISLNDVGELKHELSVQYIELEMQHDELLRANQQLNELKIRAEHQRDRYSVLFDLLPAGVLVLNANGVIRECNRYFSRMVGKDHASLARRTLAEFVAPRDRMNFDVLFRQEINHPEGKKIYFSLTNSKGRIVPVAMAVAKLGAETGNEEELMITLTGAIDEQ